MQVDQKTVATVLHPVDPGSISGFCSVHERLLCVSSADSSPLTLESLGKLRRDPNCCGLRNRLLSLDEAVQELAHLKGVGGDLILDCTTAGEGRDPQGLVKIARRTGMLILMGASVAQIKGTALCNTPECIESIGRELRGQLLLGEEVPDPAAAKVPGSKLATVRVQAGFISVALERDSDAGAESTGGCPKEGAAIGIGDLRDDEVALLRGSAWAQRETGAPLVIAVPPFAGSTPEQALACFLAGGGDPSKLILAGMHGGCSQPLDAQRELLRAGATLCFDLFGRTEWLPGPNFFPSDEQVAARVAELARLGYGAQLLISQGVMFRTHLTRYGGFGYGHAILTVPPRLKRLGMTGGDVSAALGGNALRLLSWYKPLPPPVVPKEFLVCSWCQGRFEPVDGEYFHKFDFVYCGVRCLRKHRDDGFKPISDDCAREGGPF
ncbi:unnamed protein product [Discosporangium mesarthrocarpum]